MGWIPAGAPPGVRDAGTARPKGRACAIALLALAAWSSGAAAAGASRSTTTSAGDTTVVTTHAGSVGGRQVIDSVTVLWQSESLERPTQLVLAGNRIAIADRTRIHLISTDGTPIATLGREGEGPGEFVQIGAMGSTDSVIFAVDRQHRHWARFDTNGAMLESGTMLLDPDLPSMMPGRIALVDQIAQLAWGSGVSTRGEPNFAGIVSHPLNGALPSERGRVIGQPYVFGASMTASLASLFGPTPIIAMAPDGRAALADGVEYCIAISGDVRPKRFCRDWDRVPVTDAVRNPDWQAVYAESGVPEAVLGPLREVLELVEVGDRRNSLTALNFDRDNRLWVHVVDSTTADIHPILIRFTPSRRPAHRHWDVFDRDGRLLWELFLPSRFTPWDAEGNTVYGIYEVDTGELVVASVEMMGEG